MENSYTEDQNVINFTKSSEDTIKLTNWENEPSLADLKEDYNGANNQQKEFLAAIQKWKDIKDITGPVKHPKVKNRSSIQPKLARKHLEWRYPSLSEPFLGTQNIFTIKPHTGNDVLAAKQNELLINYQFNNLLNKVTFIDEFVRRNVDQGICIVKTYWEKQTKKQLQKIPIFSFSQIDPNDQQSLEQLQQNIQLKQRDYNNFLNLSEEEQEAVKYFEENKIPTIARIEDYTEQLVDVVVKNQPRLDIIDPNNIRIDPSCGNNYKDARFIIVSYETCKADLQRDGRFVNLDKIDFSSESLYIDSEHKYKASNDFNFKDTSRRRIVAHEYWGLYDIHNTGELVSVLITWINDTIIRMEENPFPNGELPFVISTYIPVLETVFGESDIELLEDSQKLTGAITRGVVDLIGKAANAQKGYKKGFLDAVNRQKFDDGMDYEFNQGIPQQDIYQHTYPEIPQTVLLLLQQQAQEAESLTGIKTFNEGINGNQFGSLAAGVRGTISATSKRESSILRRLIHAMQDIGKKVCIMNQEFMSEDQVVRITDQSFVTVRKEDLAGNYDLKIDIDNPDVNEKQCSDLAFLLQTLGPKSSPKLVNTILAHIARLKRLPDLEKQILEIPTDPSPQEQELRQLEIQKVQLEVQKLMSEIKVNEATAIERQAKAQSTNVDTQEQIAGISHTRNMETIKAQAKANQKLEITKGLMDKDIDNTDVVKAIGYDALTENS